VQRTVQPIFGRNRPRLGREVLGVGIRTTAGSFPSGLTASSVAAATAISAFYPKVSPLVFGLAAGVGVSRVHLGHHFPSDVAVGGLIGIASGAFLAWLVKAPRTIYARRWWRARPLLAKLPQLGNEQRDENY